MTVTAPPRPPRPSDPVDREEIEALVEALIEEARQRARRRRRIYVASVSLVAVVAVGVSTVLQRSTQSDHRFSGVRGAIGPSRRTTSSKSPSSATTLRLLWPRWPFALYVMNADGSG